MEQIQIMKWFRYRHLPPKLQAVSKACADLAEEMVKLPPSDELRQGLRKLLEAKDAFVRAAAEEPVSTTLEQEIARSAELAKALASPNPSRLCLKQIAPGAFCAGIEGHPETCLTPKAAKIETVLPSTPDLPPQTLNLTMMWKPVNWLAPPYPCPSCNIPDKTHPAEPCRTCGNTRQVAKPSTAEIADFLAKEALVNGWAAAWQFFSTAAAALRLKNTNAGV